MHPLRDYQRKALGNVAGHWRSSRSVLLVAPTGAGKTRMGVDPVVQYARAGRKVLWVVHRRELWKQAKRALAREGVTAGVIAAGVDRSPHEPVQVASVQTWLRRTKPEADLVVFDEAHHYEADEWGAVGEHYSGARVLGLTATPERIDGRPLGDSYEQLVVAAQYPDLVRDGYLVPCRVIRPDKSLNAGLGKDPVKAILDRGEGRSGFVYCSTVAEATRIAAELTDNGIRTGVISHETKLGERARLLAAMESGEIRMLANVMALTEGVDIPRASLCVLARGCSHVTPYLQMVGRVLRPAPGKEDSIFLDLSGVSHSHGLPLVRREYSLKGKGIKASDEVEALRLCPFCGHTQLSADGPKCLRCGKEFPRERREKRQPKIYDMELREVFAGADTPEWAKQKEKQRLVDVAKERGWTPWFLKQQYEALFGPDTKVLNTLSDTMKRKELDKLREQAEKRGYKPGWASYKYKSLFGEFPPREW